MINRCFRIIDAKGRDWGTFTVEKESINYLGEKLIHGYLKPTPSYNEVRNLFLVHDKEMSQEGDVLSLEMNELIDLKPHIIDCDSNNILDIEGNVFVSEDLLVTCKIVNR